MLKRASSLFLLPSRLLFLAPSPSFPPTLALSSALSLLLQSPHRFRRPAPAAPLSRGSPPVSFASLFNGDSRAACPGILFRAPFPPASSPALLLPLRDVPLAAPGPAATKARERALSSPVAGFIRRTGRGLVFFLRFSYLPRGRRRMGNAPALELGPFSGNAIDAGQRTSRSLRRGFRAFSTLPRGDSCRRCGHCPREPPFSMRIRFNYSEVIYLSFRCCPPDSTTSLGGQSERRVCYEYPPRY